MDGSGVCSVAVVGFGRVIQAGSTNQERHNGDEFHAVSPLSRIARFPLLAYRNRGQVQCLSR